MASGRDSDIFEDAPGLVRRRSRLGRSLADEARVMEYARRQGYPVPAVHQLSDDGTELTMERVDGPTMVAAVERRPWTVRRHAGILAELHRRLHDLPAPDDLPGAPVGAGDRLLHLDLHPLNVLMGPRGPVVIDWPNARAGDPAVDVALTWALAAAGEIPVSGVRGPGVRLLRSTFVTTFLRHCDRRAAESQLRPVVEWKAGDPNLDGSEVRRMRALLEATGTDGRLREGRPHRDLGHWGRKDHGAI